MDTDNNVDGDQIVGDKEETTIISFVSIGVLESDSYCICR
jgi:hypothetical protein